VTETTPEELLDKVQAMRGLNARLVQICCTYKENIEITYSFDVSGELEHIRLHIPPDQTIKSVTGIYPAAFLYENEMKDLFGVKIDNISVDFNGSFYKLSKPTPFAG
jgi:ech hydrogenase subunit D